MLHHSLPLAAALALAGSATAPAQTAPAQIAWLHVRVEEPARDSRVHVNLPMNVVEAAMALAPEKVVSGGRIRLHHGRDDIKVADLRRLWSELRQVGDADFVSAKDGDETVSVRRRGEKLLVDVEKKGDEKVKVEVPVSVVDALFSSDAQELNLKQAVAELRKLRGEIVKVDGKDGSVRVWIDEKN